MAALFTNGQSQAIKSIVHFKKNKKNNTKGSEQNDEKKRG
jgi:hypothetical protein